MLCIVGMGISGISMARWSKKYKINTVILEKNPYIGGCWLEKSYPNVILQTTKKSYSYSDFPMPKEFPLYPSRKNIMDYLISYCEKHNLLENVNFNSCVKNTDWNSNKKLYSIVYEQNGENKIINSKYLCVCSGFYTTPKIPRFKGMEKFKGEIKHNVEWSYLGKETIKSFENKNILIIGNGPSGCDLACLAVKNKAKEVLLLYRTPRWIFMRKLSIVSLHFILNRTFLWFGSNIPNKLFLIIIYILYYVPFYLNGHDMIWELPNEIITRKNLTLNDDIFEYVKNNDIKYIRGSIDSFEKNKIKIKISGKIKKISPDLVLMCTGFKQDIKFMKYDRIPYLYKRIVSPFHKNCGFIGFVATFNWVQVSDLQARWFINHILGKIKLIDVPNMICSIKNDIKLNDNSSLDYHDFAYKAYEYSDLLAKDMNIVPKTSKFSPKYWFNISEYDEWT